MQQLRSDLVYVQVSALIRWVMSANPADRPTARELLRSDLLPPTVGDEQLQDVLRSLQDKYARMIFISAWLERESFAVNLMLAA